MNTFLSSLVLVGVLAGGAFLWHGISDSARLEPDRREILIREVDNGYVVIYRTTNNPYPVRESVALDPPGVALYVRDYLKQPIPGPRWGK